MGVRISSRLLCRFANGDEIPGDQTGTADQGAVNIGLGEELGGILGINTASVLDPHRLCNGLAV